jgi:hypothetical protein
MSKLTNALNSLKPTSQWKIIGEDYAAIEWLSLDGIAPTQKEIDDEIKKLVSTNAKAETNKAAAKQSAQAKLAALGLTSDEVTAIIGA